MTTMMNIFTNEVNTFQAEIATFEAEIARIQAKIAASQEHIGKLAENETLVNSWLETGADLISKIRDLAPEALSKIKSSVLNLFEDGNQPIHPEPKSSDDDGGESEKLNNFSDKILDIFEEKVSELGLREAAAEAESYISLRNSEGKDHIDDGDSPVCVEIISRQPDFGINSKYEQEISNICVTNFRANTDTDIISLNGQICDWARGWATPLCSLLEEAPLLGQYCDWASPLYCLLEDAPDISLKGQYCDLAEPLILPALCRSALLNNDEIYVRFAYQILAAQGSIIDTPFDDYFESLALWLRDIHNIDVIPLNPRFKYLFDKQLEESNKSFDFYYLLLIYMEQADQIPDGSFGMYEIPGYLYTLRHKHRAIYKEIFPYSPDLFCFINNDYSHFSYNQSARDYALLCLNLELKRVYDFIPIARERCRDLSKKLGKHQYISQKQWDNLQSIVQGNHPWNQDALSQAYERLEKRGFSCPDGINNIFWTRHLKVWMETCVEINDELAPKD